MYSFQLSLVSADGARAQASIVQLGVIMGSVYGDTTDLNQGTTAAVFVCNEGEEVWARAEAATSLGADASGLYNVFSGHLVYPV